MIRWLLLLWHRFREWRHSGLSLRHYQLARRHQARGHRHGNLAAAHGSEADAIRPPREWDPRLTDRGGHTDLHPPPGAPGA